MKIEKRRHVGLVDGIMENDLPEDPGTRSCHVSHVTHDIHHAIFSTSLPFERIVSNFIELMMIW